MQLGDHYAYQEEIISERRLLKNVVVMKDIEQKQLTWYGHIQRMYDTRLPKQS